MVNLWKFRRSFREVDAALKEVKFDSFIPFRPWYDDPVPGQQWTRIGLETSLLPRKAR